jgi:hypothetical protein
MPDALRGRSARGGFFGLDQNGQGRGSARVTEEGGECT